MYAKLYLEIDFVEFSVRECNSTFYVVLPLTSSMSILFHPLLLRTKINTLYTHTLKSTRHGI